MTGPGPSRAALLAALMLERYGPVEALAVERHTRYVPPVADRDGPAAVMHRRELLTATDRADHTR